MKSYLMPHAPVFLPNIGGEDHYKVKNTIRALEYVANEIKAEAPETIVIISPHGPRFSDVLSVYNQRQYVGDFMLFGDYEHAYNFDKDQEFIDRLIEISQEEHQLFYPVDEMILKEFDQPKTLDHGVLVPLYFVQNLYPSFKLVCISSGNFSYDQLVDAGKIIRETAKTLNRKIVVIGSGDLSHSLSNQGPYDFHPSGPMMDQAILDAIKSKRVEKLAQVDPIVVEEANICGLESLMMILGLYEGYLYSAEVLNYEGPFGVGYGVASFDSKAEIEVFRAEKIRKAIFERVKISRKLMNGIAEYGLRVLEARYRSRVPVKINVSENGYLIDGQFFNASKEIMDQLTQPVKNIFVSIKNDGGLRGCIGVVDAEETQPFYQKIAYYVWQAAQHDPRFNPVEKSEIDRLTISVDLLSEYREIERVEARDVKKEGILVTDGISYGILLPDIHGVDTPVEQLRIAAQKGGFPVDGILKKFTFTVERFQ